jgi:predicted porin
MARTLLAATLFLAVVGPQPGGTADFAILPTVNLKTEFDSNLNFSFRTRLKDYILTLNPTIPFRYATEAGFVEGRVALKGMHFITHSNLDTVDQNYEMSSAYQITPRLNLSFGASYVVDSTMEEELLASGLIIGRTGRNAVRAAPGLSYVLSERWKASLGYDFSQVTYDNPRLRNYLIHSVKLSPSYQFPNEKTSLVGVCNTRFTEYTDGDQYTTLGTYAGVQHQFSATWFASLFAGANFSWMSYRTLVFDFFGTPVAVPTRKLREQSSINPYFELSTTKNWEKFSLTGGYSRDQSAASAGTIYETNRAYLTMAVKITEKCRSSLKGEFYLSQNIQQQTSYQQLSYRVAPEISYQLTEKLFLSSNYSFQWRENQQTNFNQNSHRHNVWLTLTYNYPLHYQW